MPSISSRPRRAVIALALSAALPVAKAAGETAFDVRLIKTGLYLIGGGGANTLIRFSAAGTILVDAKLPGLYRALASQVRRISRLSDHPVRVLLLTGSDAARAGNAAQFLAAGIPVVAQRRAAARLPAADAKSPLVAFDDDYALRLGGAELRLLHFGRAYSDADAVVHFSDLKVVALGALFTPDAADAPVPDFAAGGSLVNWAPVLDQVLTLDFELVVGADGAPRPRGDLEAFKTRIEMLVDLARSLVRQGAAPDQLPARLQAADSGWSLRFTPEQLAAFHAELANAR